MKHLFIKMNCSKTKLHNLNDGFIFKYDKLKNYENGKAVYEERYCFKVKHKLYYELATGKKLDLKDNLNVIPSSMSKMKNSYKEN